MSFWSNKPLKLNSGLKNDNTYILDSDSLLLNINTEISNSKFSLDYYIVTSPDDFFSILNTS